MSGMDELIAFLRARLDEDEQVALAAKGHRVFDGTGIVADRDRSVTLGSHVATHIARHDPARVLADVEAKRQIIEGFAELHHNPARHTDAVLHLQWNVLRHVVLVLAQPFADHPDYREEWRP
jgi:hypothetical protein